MKTSISNLRFGDYLSRSGATNKRMSIAGYDDEEEYEAEENPWVCCKCGNGNNGEISLCDVCGHNKCSHCPEI